MANNTSAAARKQFTRRTRRELWALISLQYEMGDVINEGRDGTVIRKVHDRFTKEVRAMKVVPAHTIDSLETVKREIDILQLLAPHQHIVEYIESYHCAEEVVLILEYCGKGDLLDQVNARGSFSEERARNLVFQIIEGLRHMHLLGIAHRDIKLENLLETKDGMLKIADFGFSSRYQPGQILTSSRGTLAYAAPVSFITLYISTHSLSHLCILHFINLVNS